MEKKQARLKRAKRTRKHIQNLEIPRLCVHRTPQHIYVQLIKTEAPDAMHLGLKHQVIACASSLDKELKGSLAFGGNVTAATKVGELIATRVKAMGITKVAFDRSGFKYHGRIKALADAARANGLDF